MILQTTLINQSDINQRTISFDNIKATFTDLFDDIYDVVLEVNSHKFLINIQSVAEHIEKFEIIAIKGFIELSNSIVNMIKRLVEHLRNKLD